MFSAHVSENAAAGAMEPVYGAFRRVFTHAFDFIVEGPAVVAIEVALEFREQISNQRMEIAWSDAGADVREEPSLHGMVDLARGPFALLRRPPVRAFIYRAEEFRVLRKYRIGKALRFSCRNKLRVAGGRAGEQFMELHVQTETGRLFLLLVHEEISSLPKSVSKHIAKSAISLSVCIFAT